MWTPDTPEFAGIWDVTGDRALRTASGTGRSATGSATPGPGCAGKRPREAAARGSSTAGIGLDPAGEREILASLDEGAPAAG